MNLETIGDRTVAAKGDYTDKAMHNHRKTYEGFLGMTKVGIGVVIAVLLILVVIYNA